MPEVTFEYTPLRATPGRPANHGPGPAGTDCRLQPLHVDDVKGALDTGVDSIVVEVPTGEHIIKYAYRWEYDLST